MLELYWCSGWCEMTPVFLMGILGLALLDSLNPATILTVGMIFLLREEQRFATAISAILGAFGLVFLSGAGLFVTAQWSATQITGLLGWISTFVFIVAGLWLIWHGVARLKPAQRKEIHLPHWVSPGTAWFFGGFFTAADLPNALPYLVAIERLVDVEAGWNALWVIFAYSLVYCLPCIFLLIFFKLNQSKMQKFVVLLHERFGKGERKASIGVAVSLIALGIAVAAVPFFFEL
ncbi:MAG: hypothetical protein RL450_758 [Actinomycetota bacterium]